MIRTGRDQPVPGASPGRSPSSAAPIGPEALYWISDARVRHVSVARLIQSTLRRLSFRAVWRRAGSFILQPVAGETVDWNRLVSDCPDLFQI